MKAQFTAGPWNVAGCEIFSADNDKMIARVFSGAESNVLLSGAISAHEADCNAALIAAAPELLSALVDAEFLMRQAGKIPGPMQDSFNRSAEDACAAINKAKGA